jgi:hypothetical protein
MANRWKPSIQDDSKRDWRLNLPRRRGEPWIREAQIISATDQSSPAAQSIYEAWIIDPGGHSAQVGRCSFRVGDGSRTCAFSLRDVQDLRLPAPKFARRGNEALRDGRRWRIGQEPTVDLLDQKCEARADQQQDHALADPSSHRREYRCNQKWGKVDNGRHLTSCTCSGGILPTLCYLPGEAGPGRLRAQVTLCYLGGTAPGSSAASGHAATANRGLPTSASASSPAPARRPIDPRFGYFGYGARCAS